MSGMYLLQMGAGALAFLCVWALLSWLNDRLTEWVRKTAASGMRVVRDELKEKLKAFDTFWQARWQQHDTECYKAGEEFEAKFDAKFDAKFAELIARIDRIEAAVNTNAVQHNKLADACGLLQETCANLTRRIEQHEKHGTGVTECNKRIDKLTARVINQDERIDDTRTTANAIRAKVEGGLGYIGLDRRLATAEQNITNLDRARVEFLAQIDSRAKDVVAACEELLADAERKAPKRATTRTRK